MTHQVSNMTLENILWKETSANGLETTIEPSKEREGGRRVISLCSTYAPEEDGHSC